MLEFFKNLPRALSLPSPARLKAANRELEQEVCNRQRAEKEIKKLNESLERRVIERTAQLEAANKELQNEITKRRRQEEALRESEVRKRAILESALDCIIGISESVTERAAFVRMSVVRQLVPRVRHKFVAAPAAP